MYATLESIRIVLHRKWVMLVIYRIAWLYIEVMFVVDDQRK